MVSRPAGLFHVKQAPPPSAPACEMPPEIAFPQLGGHFRSGA